MSKARNLGRVSAKGGFNLFWGVERILNVARMVHGGVESVKRVVVDEALKMADEDVEVNRRLGKNGVTLIDNGDTVLTHCKW